MPISHPDSAAITECVPSSVNLDLVAGISECLSLYRTVPLLNGDHASSLLDAIETIRVLSEKKREELANRLTDILNSNGGFYNVTSLVPLPWADSNGR